MKQIISSIVFLLFFSSVQAASFDCAKASSKMEQAICSNPDISTLDETMAARFKAAKEQLSPNGSKLFVRGQVSWLRFTASFCFIDYNAAPASSIESVQCLSQAYKKRIQELEQTGKLIGGFKSFIVLDEMIKINKTEQSLFTVQRDFIQLDDDSETGKRLNAWLGFKNTIELNDSTGSEFYSVTLSKPSPDWFYKTQFSEFFTGAHPSSDQTCSVYSLSLKRPLTIGDIFSSAQWQVIATNIVKKHFSELAKVEKDFSLDMVFGYENFQQKPEKEFSFCFDQNGMYVDGFLPHVIRSMDGVTLRWSELSTVLTHAAQAQLQLMTDSVRSK